MNRFNASFYLNCKFVLYFSFFQKDFIYLVLDKGEGKEKDMERNINVWLPLAHTPSGDLAHNPGMCPDRESNGQPFDSQDGAQSTEPHKPGLYFS